LFSASNLARSRNFSGRLAFNSKVAQWGAKSKTIHWKVAGIAKTVGEYAIGGWERSPSAKQAKWAMEAYKTAEEAGALIGRSEAG
jgi:hypothetical protein